MSELRDVGAGALTLRVVEGRPPLFQQVGALALHVASVPGSRGGGRPRTRVDWDVGGLGRAGITTASDRFVTYISRFGGPYISTFLGVSTTWR